MNGRSWSKAAAAQNGCDLFLVSSRLIIGLVPAKLSRRTPLELSYFAL